MERMKILFVIHAAFERPGCIESWAKKHGHQTQEVNPYKGEKLPDIKDFDFLVVMGGPQSPLKIDKAPYLADEIKLIKQAVKEKKRILGVCLGAQLIGEALGAKTEQSPSREIGVYPIELLDGAKYDPIFQRFPESFDVMHWHSDMPGIPEGAVLLARSEGCPRQAFSYGDRIYGFQCHFELTQELVKGMIENCSDDLKAGTYVRTEKELMETEYSQINSKLENALDYLANLPELILHDICQDKDKTSTLRM
jgi:GMP synthase (glutamine-hydrolysing)